MVRIRIPRRQQRRRQQAPLDLEERPALRRSLASFRWKVTRSSITFSSTPTLTQRTVRLSFIYRASHFAQILLTI